LPHQELTERRRPQWIVLALLAFVILLDQSTKWWAWREVPDAHANLLRIVGNADVDRLDTTSAYYTTSSTR